jgi:hypothetical protein
LTLKTASSHPLILFLGLLVAVAVPAQDSPDLDRRSLKGIKGVLVYAGVAKSIEETGLLTSIVKTDTELKLRQAGIRVLETDAEFRSTPGSPMLVVAVEGVSHEGVFGFSLSVSLSQSVVLQRDPSLRPVGEFRHSPFIAETWSTTTVGVHVGNPSDYIRSSVNDLVDQFVNAYLSANKDGPTVSRRVR